MRLKKHERQAVFEKYEGHCAYCGCKLDKKWHADHLKPVIRELEFDRENGRLKSLFNKAHQAHNHNLENMMPACAPCNISKSSMDLEVWRKWLEQHVQSLNLYHKIYRMAKAYGLVQETGTKVVFHFEKVRVGLV